MIIGLIGPVQEDIEFIVDSLNINKKFQYVDTIELLRISDRSVIGSLTAQDNYKKYVLKKLENTFGTVVVSGNLVLSEKICEWLLNNGNLLSIVSRGSMDKYDEHVLEYTGRYWEDKASQRYNLEERWSKMYDRISKSSSTRPYLIDVSNKDNVDFNNLLAKSVDFDDSTDCNWSYEELLEHVKVRRGDNMSTMEESIRKAMMELGMEVDGMDDEPAVKETTKKHEKKAETKKPEKKPESKKVDVKKTKTEDKPDEKTVDVPMTEVVEETVEEANSESIFVKMTDTHMAILLPSDLTLEKQEIGGVEFMVATVQLPNINSRKLQELSIINESDVNTVKDYKRQPIIASNADNSDVIDDSSDISDLTAEKARLDSEIKKYRAAGDMDKVDELRKQRRVIRNKINKLK